MFRSSAEAREHEESRNACACFGVFLGALLKPMVTAVLLNSIWQGRDGSSAYVRAPRENPGRFRALLRGGPH